MKNGGGADHLIACLCMRMLVRRQMVVSSQVLVTRKHDFFRLLGKCHVEDNHKISEIIGSAPFIWSIFGIVYLLMILISCDLRVNGEELP